MDPEIRAAIIAAFAASPTRSKDSLLPEIARKLGKEQPKIWETLKFMEDNGEVLPEGHTGYRLTLSAKISQAPLIERALKYATDNWLALTALVLSAIATISAAGSTIIALIAFSR